MFTPHPQDALLLAHAHLRRLRDEAAAERPGGAPTLRSTIAASLRHAADRLDPAALVPQPGPR